MSRSTRKPILWTLRKESIRISQSMPCRLTKVGHVSPPVDFLFLESLLYTSFPLRRNVLLRLAFADWADWYGPIHYADSLMLVFSWNGSYIWRFCLRRFGDDSCLSFTEQFLLCVFLLFNYFDNVRNDNLNHDQNLFNKGN